MINRSIERLEEAIRVVCPTDSVSVGTFGVSASCSFVPSAGATAQQITNGQTVIDAFDWSEATQNAWLDSKEPDLAAIRDQAIQAIADINAYLVFADTATQAQARTEIKQIDIRQRAIIKAVARLAAKIL